MTNDPSPGNANDVAGEHPSTANPLGWFEALYVAADNDTTAIPWADRGTNPSLLDWFLKQPTKGQGKRALVVGCGLGDDAEELARRGFEVTAFDIAPTAVAWCKQRFPNSSVAYVCADLFARPTAWRQAFDFIFEANTLQALPDDLRPGAMACIADCLAVDGTLLVVARGRDKDQAAEGPPWPLARDEFDPFTASGLHERSFEDYMDEEDPPVRRFRIVYKR